jgi:hypothetical protein
MATKRVRLVFADEGSFHTETITIDSSQLEEYDRLIDLLREDPSVTRQIYVDLRRLVSAALADDDS